MTYAFPCAEKWRFTTKSQAKRRAKLTAQRAGNKRLRAYHCPHCDGYHLTSQNVKALAKAQGK